MDPTLLIGDIVERESTKKPVSDTFDDPVPISSTGFPQHKRRWKSSAFKERRAAGAGSTDTQSNTRDTKPQKSVSFEENERKRIDQENRKKLEDMTPEEIIQAQKDIMNGLNPAMIQRLLQRSTIDAPVKDSPFDLPKETEAEAALEVPQQPTPKIEIEDTSAPPKPPSAPESASSANRKPSTKISDDYDEDAEPPQPPPDLFPITDLPKSTHFPAAPNLPDLDPSDPNFLQTLHKKYFPNLPADPSKLAWMAPVPTEDSVADKESPYYPHPEIAISALRFDFRGQFLSPRISRSIPSSKGLHHHGQAPEAAGYTIEELAHLARSAVPAQRCIAFQTLGRILYRLGTGEWGKTEDDPIAMGVWNSVKKGRVLDSLTEAAANEGGHRGSRAYATEALWLFEKGGWKEKHKGR
jgi:RNA polymerase II-associated protein 1